MHDLLEGVTSKVLSLVLNRLIFTDKFFSLDFINHKINSFAYGYVDQKNKPAPLKEQQIKNGKKLSLKASQCWCLMRNIPLMIGMSVPEDNLHYSLLLIHLDILDIIFCPIISVYDTHYLSDLISEHHKLFLFLFPTQNLTPKFHNMVHYPSVIRTLGPPVHYWTMRYESSHQLPKKAIKNSQCHINIAKTASKKLSFHLFHVMMMKDFKNDIEFGTSHKLSDNDIYEFNSICKTDLFKNHKCLSFSWLKLNLITYKRDSVLLVKWDFSNDPVFGIIKDIIHIIINVK